MGPRRCAQAVPRRDAAVAALACFGDQFLDVGAGTVEPPADAHDEARLPGRIVIGGQVVVDRQQA